MSDVSDEASKTALEIFGAAMGGKATYAGAGVSAASWWFSSEAGVILGIFLGVVGLCVQVYFKLLHDRRERQYHEVRMEEIFKAMAPQPSRVTRTRRTATARPVKKATSTSKEKEAAQ